MAAISPCFFFKNSSTLDFPVTASTRRIPWRGSKALVSRQDGQRKISALLPIPVDSENHRLRLGERRRDATDLRPCVGRVRSLCQNAGCRQSSRRLGRTGYGSIEGVLAYETRRNRESTLTEATIDRRVGRQKHVMGLVASRAGVDRCGCTSRISLTEVPQCRSGNCQP